MTENTSTRDKMWTLAFGLLLVTIPAITLVTAYAVLTVTQSAVLEQLEPIELVEWYVVELVAFGLLSYALYRLARYAWTKHDATIEQTVPTSAKESRSVESVEKDGN
ncbi:hypothetical protein [Haloferax sp. DFSO60]|uniref:hypothetical protein n=1 Tax=Haloferax sp. DFSO60 TaxID=3388652 RepID=UPI00397C7B11